MPTHLQTLIRLKTIDNCLRDLEGSWSWQRLVEECEAALLEHLGVDANLSRRTIMYDIHYMKNGKFGYHAPIVYDRGRKSYKYSDPEFSIGVASGPESAREDLKQALLLLGQYRGNQKINGIGEVIARLEQTIDHSEGQSPVVIDEPSAPGVLSQLRDAIQEEQPVTLELAQFGRKPKGRTYSPYFLRLYLGQWYLFAYSHKRKKAEYIPLILVTGCWPSLQDFKKDKTSLKASKNSRDVIGLSEPESDKVQKVRLQVSPTLANDLVLRPIHYSQTVEKKGKKATKLRLKIHLNQDLEALIMSYGDGMEVIGPATLRKNIARKFSRANKMYK